MAVVTALVPTGALAAPTTAAAGPVAPITEHSAHPVHQLCPAPTKPGKMTCLGIARDDVPGHMGRMTADADPAGYGPADLRSAYTLPNGTAGTGQTVAIVDAYDNPGAEADLAVYRAQYGLPACTTANGCFRKIDQRGGTAYPSPDAGWAGEISLDLDMVSAVCPNCRILLVEADAPSMEDLGAAVNQAVSLGAKYVSNSYGGGEDPSLDETDAQYFDHPGVAITASSGDNGYGVSYPASSKYVTAVGGTSLNRDSGARGWSERAWSGSGSGCSAYAQKPPAQQDSGCSRRMVADVSAVADPQTGLAVYNSYQAGGWSVYGGTSASAPIIAGVYALASTPAAGSRPNAYPYAADSGLNDVTAGANGSCSDSYLCTAIAGYDGPTGLGAPQGVSAFGAIGDHSQLSGAVTDRTTGAPLAGARITAGDVSATTDAQGHYTLLADPGEYDVTAEAFGYADAPVHLTLDKGGIQTRDFALAPVPSVTVTGRVADGSGHGWPLYAAITSPDIPGRTIHTDPYTGAYSVELPVRDTYRLHIAAVYPGYSAVDQTLEVGTVDVAHDVAVPVDAVACKVLGYAERFDGISEPFDGGTAPARWSVQDAAGKGQVWAFNDPTGGGNHTTGKGGFASVDSIRWRTDSQDTTLVSPAADLTKADSPQLSFNTLLQAVFTPGAKAVVDVSVDGGQSWQQVWERHNSGVAGGRQTVQLPQAAHQADVRVRFHYTGTSSNRWHLDDVNMGQRLCGPQPGGLVVGQVTDANTKAGLVDIKVSDADQPAVNALSVATPTDDALGDGLYWLFSTKGTHTFGAVATRYSAASKTATVGSNAVRKANLALPAGRLSVKAVGLSPSVSMGSSKTGALTLTNTGGAATTVNLNEDGSKFGLLARQGAELQHRTTDTTPHALVGTKVHGPAPMAPAAVDGSWSFMPMNPSGIMDQAASTHDGKLYSVGGLMANGMSELSLTGRLDVFDAANGGWRSLKVMPRAREKPAGAFLGDKLYVAGGWLSGGTRSTDLDIYDPKTDAWSAGAPMPKALVASSAAALDGKMYLIGGCEDSCGTTDVWVYNPDLDRWSKAASYPQPTAWASCGAISGKLYCAGGTTDEQSTKKAYAYDPVRNTWTALADMPEDLWASAYTTANGMLLVSGGTGLNGAYVSNGGYAYDPVAGEWTSMPNTYLPRYRGAGACGMYALGGTMGGFEPSVYSERLLGFDSCDGTDVSWLSLTERKVTLQPGESTTVSVTLDASAASIAQPGAYTGSVEIGTDTPYGYAPVGVTMNVTPPNSWGKITGTVYGADCDGKPAALTGATVQVDAWAANYTLRTDRDGHYALWLDRRNNPLSLLLAADDWQPQTRTVKVVAGATVHADFTLKSGICTGRLER
ncbi:carboxypeptidase regulatory-like domain-containing protein [Streptomyces sp. NBC_00344]|uniref:carboxypeptidase regulatory-like domain-containing protein n=1 Tax=Streptomyces sp. NBC_00344 TaxID=2975720 RepID=UPI002E1EA405